MATWNDPHPLANPFNTRSYGNFNTMTAQRGLYIRHTHANPKKLTVPNQDIPYNGSPEWYDMQRQNGLTVPNQDVPMGDMANNFGNAGFLNDRLFRLQDGTVMDYKTGRVFACAKHSADRVISPEDAGFAASGNWGSSADGPSLEELVRNTDRYVNTATPGGFIESMDPRSAAYWLRANAEAEKLKAGMTDEQRRLIAAFEAHFPKSRLIEESKRAETGEFV